MRCCVRSVAGTSERVDEASTVISAVDFTAVTVLVAVSRQLISGFAVRRRGSRLLQSGTGIQASLCVVVAYWRNRASESICGPVASAPDAGLGRLLSPITGREHNLGSYRTGPVPHIPLVDRDKVQAHKPPKWKEIQKLPPL
jgi:hypothetical protein